MNGVYYDSGVTFICDFHLELLFNEIFNKKNSYIIKIFEKIVCFHFIRITIITLKFGDVAKMTQFNCFWS